MENKITFVTSNNEAVSIFTDVQVDIFYIRVKMNKLVCIYYEKSQKPRPTVMSPPRKAAALWNNDTTRIA